MKDLDQLLKRHQPKPKRPLSTNFTQTITSELRAHPRPSIAQRLRSLPAQLTSKTGLAALAGMVLVSGSVAAFALWPRPNVTPMIHKELPSGNHIVGYDAQNCHYFAGLDGAPFKPTKEALYYEVRQGSLLTDQQLQNALRAICEENISNNAISAVIKQLPQNTPGLQSTLAYTINAIGPDSITVTLDPHYNAKDYTIKPNMTYTHFASHLLLYNEDNKASYSDFKEGDTVKLIVQDTSGNSSETPGGYNAMNHPEHITILAMIKIPPLTADPSLFYRAVGSDLVRVEPCNASPTGFCRAYDFAQ